MKHQTNVFLIVLLSLSFVAVSGCSGSDPTTVVKQFDAAVRKGDKAAMEKLATPETIELLPIIAIGMSDWGEIKSCTHNITGEAAVATVQYTNHAKPIVFDLKKIDGKWKVHLTK
jgi:hypothetical protein